MRPLVETLAKIAAVSAIASSAIERSKKDAVHLWRELEECAMDATHAFPGKLNKKELDKLIEVEADIYEHYQRQARREYALCNLSGLRAADKWSRIWA